MDQGIIERETHGDLTDLIARRHAEQATVSIAPDDMLSTALARMKLYDFQQLPVLAGDRAIGIIDESDILMAVYADADRFRAPVREAMTSRLETLQANAPIDALLPIFGEGKVAIIMDGDRFLGLITRYDLLNYLRRRAR
jgi:cystathionine beta-synthase